MRKIIWFASALTVASVVGMYCASDYAARNPGSVFGRTFASVARYSPMGVLTGWRSVEVEIGGSCCCEKTPLTSHPGATEASEPFEPIVLDVIPICPPPEDLWVEPETREPLVGKEDTRSRQWLPRAPEFMPYAPEDMKKNPPQEEEFGVEIGLGSSGAILFKLRSESATELLPLPFPLDQLPDQVKALEDAIRQQRGEEPSDRVGPGRELIPDCYHHDGCPYLNGVRPTSFPFPLNLRPVKPIKVRQGDDGEVIEHRSLRINLDAECSNCTNVDTMDYRPRDDGPALPPGQQPF